METPIEILEKENPEVGFDPRQQTVSPTLPIPTGNGQGVSSIKETFVNTFQKVDIISAVVVFFLLLLAFSGFATIPIKSVPTFFYDNKVTNLGTVVLSIVGTLVYLIIKVIASKFS